MQLMIEIARREAELLALDSRIAEMRARLGSEANLDDILAMAEQKAELCRRLDELRQRCLAEEHKRHNEIEFLIQPPPENLLTRITADLTKYRKITSNQYASDMKGAAWDALISSYPEAKNVLRHDVNAFLAVLGFSLVEGRIVAARIIPQDDKPEEVKKSESAELKPEGQMFTDPASGLIWAKNGNIAGREMKWDDAMSWVKNLDYCGFCDWRLPTNIELASFVKPGGDAPSAYFNSRGFFNVQPEWYWSDTEDDCGIVWAVSMGSGKVVYSSKIIDGHVWPVRG